MEGLPKHPNETIRKATKADVQTLLAFEQGVIAAERPFDPTLKKETIYYYDIEYLIRADHTMLLVAGSEGLLIGCGYARVEDSKPYLKHSKHAYLGFMYVDPKHRGKGVNKRIIKALTEWAAAKNVYELRLEVYMKNSSAVKAYEKAGFSSHIIEMRLPVGKENTE